MFVIFGTVGFSEDEGNFYEVGCSQFSPLCEGFVVPEWQKQLLHVQEYRFEPWIHGLK